MLCRSLNNKVILVACMNPVLNRNSEIQRLEHSDAIEIHDRKGFIFYPGLPHTRSYLNTIGMLQSQFSGRLSPTVLHQ